MGNLSEYVYERQNFLCHIVMLFFYLIFIILFGSYHTDLLYDGHFDNAENQVQSMNMIKPSAILRTYRYASVLNLSNQYLLPTSLAGEWEGWCYSLKHEYERNSSEEE